MTAIPECQDRRSTPLPAALTKAGSEVTLVTATRAQIAAGPPATVPGLRC
jgi:hypothetical protein